MSSHTLNTSSPARPNASLGSLFAYKAWANAELFAALDTMDVSTYPDQARQALRILNHVYVVDRIFQAHLQGRDHAYAATNTEETPTVAALAAAVKDLDTWYVSYAQGLAPEARHEQVRFVFTDGDTGCMSREEILLHVITHGGYHRGAAGQVMRGAAVAPLPDLYTRFLHSAEPWRRTE